MRVLVAWGSKRGGTEGLARAVAEGLRDAGHVVDEAPDERCRETGRLGDGDGDTEVGEVDVEAVAVDEQLDALARQQLASRGVALTRAFGTTQGGFRDFCPQFLGQGAVMGRVAGESVTGRVDNGVQLRHDRRLASSTPSRKS